MKDNARIILVLTLICILCGFALSFAFNSAKAKIEANQREYILRAIYNISEECKDVKEVDIEGRLVYKLFDYQDRLVGFAYLSEGQGYQGKIKILFGVDEDLERLLGIEIIESVETPGLGAKISQDTFKEQFRNLTTLNNLECVKFDPYKENQIKAITSATVSSRAVVKIVNEGLEELKLLVKNERGI
jgi:electron transport complex protein RnfG